MIHPDHLPPAGGLLTTSPLQVAYFVVSIVNSLAQSYRKRLEREKRID